MPFIHSSLLTLTLTDGYQHETLYSLEGVTSGGEHSVSISSYSLLFSSISLV